MCTGILMKINDIDRVNPPYDNPMRRPFERLIRKLLNYPRCDSICQCAFWDTDGASRRKDAGVLEGENGCDFALVL